MEFGCKFNLTLLGFEDKKGQPGDPLMCVSNNALLFMFDGSKMHFNLRKPTDEELKSMVPIVLT